MQGFHMPPIVHSMTFRNRIWPVSAGGLACCLPNCSSAPAHVPLPVKEENCVFIQFQVLQLSNACRPCGVCTQYAILIMGFRLPEISGRKPDFREAKSLSAYTDKCELYIPTSLTIWINPHPMHNFEYHPGCVKIKHPTWLYSQLLSMLIEIWLLFLACLNALCRLVILQQHNAWCFLCKNKLGSQQLGAECVGWYRNPDSHHALYHFQNKLEFCQVGLLEALALATIYCLFVCVKRTIM